MWDGVHVGNTYTVKSGDTCIAIAKSSGITVAALKAANPSINAGCTNLQVGQVLSLSGTPTPAPTPAGECVESNSVLKLFLPYLISLLDLKQ